MNFFKLQFFDKLIEDATIFQKIDKMRYIQNITFKFTYFPE